MKYKIEKDKLIMFPEKPMDVFYLGKIWGKHGGFVGFTSHTDHPENQIDCYKIPLDALFKILIDP